VHEIDWQRIFLHACHEFSSFTMPRRLPPLNALRVFEAASRHASFTHAASELAVTQGAVSRHVCALEDWLGVKLFARTLRGVTLTPKGIAYSRIVGDSNGFSLPDDLYAWKSTCHHNHNLMELGREFLSLHKSQYLYMMYVWGHSYEFDLQDNWALIEEFCEMAGGKDDIWYASNIEIVDYMDAADRLQFSATGKFVYNPSAVSIWLSVDGCAVECRGGVQTQL
jgi:hypothetical protein